MIKVLLTSASFNETPGDHHQFLKEQNFQIDFLEGPLKSNVLLPIIGQYDAVICGDDEYNYEVLKEGRNGRLRYISKYGVGLDMIDLKKATELGIKVANCKSINQLSVSEHVFALLLAFERNIPKISQHTKDGQWLRITGHEINGKTFGVVGIGAVGKEVLIKAKTFGLKPIGYDVNPDRLFLEYNQIELAKSFEDLVKECDFISLHLPLSKETEQLINEYVVKNLMKKGVVLINTARGKLVNNEALVYGLDNAIIRGYLTDVLDIEPMPEDYFLRKYENVIITSHIGSRTFESVVKQGKMAIQNLVTMLQKTNNVNLIY